MWLRMLLTLLIVVLAGSAWLHQRAQQVLAEATTALRPHVLLRYERAIAWPGGRIDLHHVTLEPVGTWRTALQVPLGYRLTIDRLRLRGLDLAQADAPVTAEARNLRIDAHGDSLWAQALRTAQHGSLSGEARIRWSGPDADDHFALTAHLDFPAQLVVDLDFSLIAGPDFPAWSARGTRLERATLRIEERGLADALRQATALGQRRTVAQWEQSLISAIDTRSQTEQWGWTTEDRTALYSFLRQPRQLALHLEPSRPVPLDELSLYAPGDRWPLFGARFSPAE